MRPLRVPVFVGHSEAVNVEFEEFLDEDEARDILRQSPGVMVVDKRETAAALQPGADAKGTWPAASIKTSKVTCGFRN